MKKAKDIVDKIQQFGTSNQNFWYVKPNDVISAIKQAQIDAIDAAVKRCAEDAIANYEITQGFFSEDVQAFVETDSILQVADKLKKELE